MTEWQPIETAPKDLSSVLVYIPGYVLGQENEIASVYWNVRFKCWCAVAVEMEPIYGEPTHWMPLPPPPA